MLSSPTNIASCLAEAGSLCWFPGEASPALDTCIVCILPPGTSGGPRTQQPADHSGLVVSDFLRGNCLLQCVVECFLCASHFHKTLRNQILKSQDLVKLMKLAWRRKPRVHGGEENNVYSCCVFTWGASSFTYHRFCKIKVSTCFLKRANLS